MSGMNDRVQAAIAANIRAEMARQRRTGVELAALLGKSRQRISARLTCKTRFTAAELTAVADWLDLSLDALADRPSPRKRKVAA